MLPLWLCDLPNARSLEDLELTGRLVWSQIAPDKVKFMDPENFEALVALMYLVWCFWGNLDESKRPQMWAHVSADLWWILVRSRVLVASFMFFLCGIRCSRTRPFHNKAPQGKILAAKWQRNLSRLDMARSYCSEVVLADIFLVNVDLQLSTACFSWFACQIRFSLSWQAGSLLLAVPAGRRTWQDVGMPRLLNILWYK